MAKRKDNKSKRPDTVVSRPEPVKRPDSVRRSEPSLSSRRTFDVARANDVLRAELPQLIYQGRPERKRPARIEATEPVLVRPPAPAKPRSVDKPQERQQLAMTEKKADCHERPKKTSGDGSSRRWTGRWCK